MESYRTAKGATALLKPFPPRGIAMVELLVAVTIIVSLISLLIPSLLHARAVARRTNCLNNLKQIAMAIQHYESQHGVLPPGFVYVPGPQGANMAGFGWGSVVLQQLDHRPLYQQIDWSQPISAPVHDSVRIAQLTVFQCPSDRSHQLRGVFSSDVEYATGNYVANFGTGDMRIDPANGEGMFSRNSAVRSSEVRDGMAHTFLVGERLNESFFAANGDTVQCLTTWAGTGPSPIDPGREAAEFVMFRAGHVPASFERDSRDASSAHPESCNFAMADGSVRNVNSAIDARVYRALATRAGDELNGRLPSAR